MKRLLILFLFITNTIYAQDQGAEYSRLATIGFEALKTTKYDSCLYYFENAFKIRQTSYLSTMRCAACAFSAGKSEIMEKQLNKAFEISWDGAKEVFDKYEEFVYLKQTEFESLVNDRYDHAIKRLNLDVDLMKNLNEILELDQKYRGDNLDFISETYGWDSPQMDSLRRLMHEADSICLNRTIAIIEDHGYPKKSEVGERAGSAVFFVIQHAPLQYQEKYLPLFKEAAENGDLQWNTLALMIDRIEMRNGRKQLYGTQLKGTNGEFYFAPMMYPYKIDSVRATVGLGPIQEYANHFNLKFNPDEHVKRHQLTDK